MDQARIKLSRELLLLFRRHCNMIELLPVQKQKSARHATNSALFRLFCAREVNELSDNVKVIQQPLVDLGAHLWRFLRSHEKIVWSLPDDKTKKASDDAFNSFFLILSSLLAILESEGILLKVYEGKPFTPNYPIEAINADKFSDYNEELFVSDTVEPAFVNNGIIIRYAKVLLSKKQ